MFVVMTVALVAVAVLHPIVAAWAIVRNPASRDHRPCARQRNLATLDGAESEVPQEGLLAGGWIGAGGAVPGRRSRS
ncbi:MAG TPA: hypothetical protein VFJ07_11010 [Streptosporangiaceae bacterium]|nr:hypothetical protein [Streptosporangiaceae bacterium]